MFFFNTCKKELAIILSRTQPDQAVLPAERLRENIQNMSFVWEGIGSQLTCSFGVSGAKGGKLPKEQSELYQQSDEALYCAKEGGRNRVMKR